MGIGWRGIAVVLVALVLVACGMKPEVDVGGPIYIADVQAVGEGRPGQLEDLQRKTMALASGLPQRGIPVSLRLEIVDFHKKDAGMSLLVGDANRLTVNVQVLSQDSGSIISHFQSVSLTDNFINGALGAVVAATADEERVMYSLNSKAAENVLERVYGSKVWRSFKRR
jgi:hypothetical protein